MAQQLGRPLRADEVVHHKNGDRVDNRPANLELWTTVQPKGQRVTDKLAYAYMLIERYASEVHQLSVPASPPQDEDVSSGKP